MQYRRVWLACMVTLLALAVLASAGGSGEVMLSSATASGGFGCVLPSPDASEAVDLPAISPAPVAYGDLAWQFPAGADPQPTFAPTTTRHVYVAARDSTITPPIPPVYVCDGVDDEQEINSAL